MSLNPEPADPQERQEQHLPPKAYADAVLQDPFEPEPHNNGHRFGDGHAETTPIHDADIDEDSIKESPPRLHPRTGSEPRALDEVLDEPTTPVRSRGNGVADSSDSIGGNLAPDPDKSYAAAAAENINGTYLQYDVVTNSAAAAAAATTDEYSGQGMDESPRVPIVRKTHKRTPSRPTSSSSSSNLSQSQTYSHSTTKKTPVQDDGPPKMVYEKFQNKDGEHLTSIKPHDAYEQSLPPAEQDMPNGDQDKSSREALVSGRRAGAGWEKSAQVSPPHFLPLFSCCTCTPY